MEGQVVAFNPPVPQFRRDVACVSGCFRIAAVAHVGSRGSMTALRKKDGGVRGIAIGTTFRRLVAWILARQFMREVEKTCAPFQFALSTRPRDYGSGPTHDSLVN